MVRFSPQGVQESIYDIPLQESVSLSRRFIAISPDGGRFAATRSQAGPILVLSAAGQVLQQIQVSGWSSLQSFDWAADGKGLILSHPTDTDPELIYVDLQGNASVLWRQEGAGPVRGISSPDGRHLAILCGGADNNVWMMENF